MTPEPHRPTRVLVTGVAGELGRSVCALYASRGIPVTGLDTEPDVSTCDRIIVGDAGDPLVVRKALDGIDSIVHLAAMASPKHGTAEEVFGNNVMATFTVLEEACRAGVRRAVIASSLSVLGLPWAQRRLHPAYLPINEQIPLQVEDPYALSKQVDEATAAMMARRHGMTTVALRFPFSGGAERLEEQAARIADDPGCAAADLWSYLDSRDVAAACALGIEAPLTGSHVAFVAAPDTLSARPTDDLLAQYHPGVPVRTPIPGRSVPIDLSAATRLLGFTALHPFAISGSPSAGVHLPVRAEQRGGR